MQEAAARHDGDKGEQERPAGVELELVAHVLHGLKADERQEQTERQQARQRGVLHGTGDVDALFRAGRIGHHLTPSRFPAARECPGAGRST
jgi:hypothetical protein